MSKLKVASDFSGVGAFNQALRRLGVAHREIFACDKDKYARQVFIHNYGEPEYFPDDVYTREIPADPLDIYMTSPPCQAFSMAGKRGGESDERGILFYNSLEFIRHNKPKSFIFENVRGLLSHDKGRTFGKWVEKLGGLSVNGAPVLFPAPDAVPYHIYYEVLNAKDFNIPQNRERIFIVGFRDEHIFSWPSKIPLSRCIADVLEGNVPGKYYLSKKMLEGFKVHAERHNDRGNGFAFKPKSVDNISSAITTRYGSRPTDTYIKVEGFVNNDTQASKVFGIDGISPTLCAGPHGYDNGYIKVNSATKKGYEIARPMVDSINFDQPNSLTRRGRVGKNVANTLTTSCNQGICDHELNIRKFTPRECLRLMDFPDTMRWDVSDTQIYKQCGNSIPVGMLAGILNKIIINLDVIK